MESYSGQALNLQDVRIVDTLDPLGFKDINAPGSTTTITVKIAGTATLATIFSDNALTAQTNPYNTDSEGRFLFYAANGRYDVVIDDGLPTEAAIVDVFIYDPLDLPTTLEIINGSRAVITGDIIKTSGFTVAGDGGGWSWLATSSNISASQTPAQTGNGSVSSADGRKFIPVISTNMNARIFGAICDGATDDLAAIQSGLVFMDTTKISPSGALPLYIDGKFSISDSIRIRDAGFIGSGSFGTTLVWGGASGGTAIIWRAKTHKNLIGMRFDGGANEPLYWFDATRTDGWSIPAFSPLMDWADNFSDLYFTELNLAGACHMKFPPVVNLYMNNMRWGGAENLVSVEAGASASANRVMSISDFTIDFQGPASGTVSSLFKIDVTGSARFTLSLEKARIESTGKDMGGQKTLIEVVDTVNGTSIPSHGIAIDLKDIGFQLVGTTGVSLIKHNTTQTNVTSDINLKNVYFDGVVNLIAGNWNSFFNPPLTLNPDGERIIDYSYGRANSGFLISKQNWAFTSTNITNTITGQGIHFGVNSPEGNVDAEKGSIYMRSGGGAGFSTYSKDTALGILTGWVTL